MAVQFNLDKCNVIRITKKRSPIIFTYSIVPTCYQLKRVNTAKYHCASISDYLSWNKHIYITIRKAINTLQLLGHDTYSFVHQRLANDMCYKRLVRPITVYASTVWDQYTQLNLNVNKRAKISMWAVTIDERAVKQPCLTTYPGKLYNNTATMLKSPWCSG